MATPTAPPVPFDHVVADARIRIDGVLAFNPGDPVPVDTAKRLKLKGSVVKGSGAGGDADFADGELRTVDATTDESGNVSSLKSSPKK